MKIEECLENISGTVDPGSPWTLVFSGNKVDLLDPQFEQILLSDICHHLARINRFTGAINRHCYSVAQHLLVATAIAHHELNAEAAVDRTTVEYYDQLLAVALHDAEEYVFDDLSSPVKAAIAPSKYKWVATNLRNKIYEKFGVDWAYHNDTVKHADLNALMIERYNLMPNSPHWPKVDPARLYFRHLPVMNPDEAADALQLLIEDLIVRRDRARLQEKRNDAPLGSSSA